MKSIVGKRLLGGLLTLWLVSVTVFLAIDLLPGDAATAIYGRGAAANPEAVNTLREQLELDRPLVVRYADWIAGVPRLDLGHSLIKGIGYRTGEHADSALGTPVWEVIRGPLKNSALIFFMSLLIIVPLSLWLGTAAALRQGSRVDGGLQISTLLAMSIPDYVLGFLLVLVFALFFEVLPSLSRQVSLSTLILPIATLVGVSLAWTARMVRRATIDVLEADYVTLARLKGLPEKRVVRRHVMPNALAPSLQSFAVMSGYLAGGIVVVEFLFSFPGIGRTMLEAVGQRDVFVVQACVLLIAAVYIVANLIADVLTIMTNPRLRTSAEAR